MNRILVLADIHGNMPAVHALEKEIDLLKPDQIWFAGDAAGKGPEGDQAVDWVRIHCDHFIQGNWDEGICKAFRSKDQPWMKFFYEQLGEERIEWLESLPFEDEILVSGMLFRIVHGRPAARLFQAWDSMDVLLEGFTSSLTGKTYDSYICADSHMPYFRASSKGYAINTGSVGNSLGIPRVHAVLLKGELGSAEKAPLTCEILSIPYDNEEAVRVAEKYPELPGFENYRKEILTGVYSR